MLGLCWYLLHQKSVGQTHLLPQLFPPQRKSLQTWGHLNLVRTLGAHKQQSSFIFTWSLLKGVVWKLAITLKFAEQTGDFIHRVVDGLNGICDDLLNVCRWERWNKTPAWKWKCWEDATSDPHQGRPCTPQSWTWPHPPRPRTEEQRWRSAALLTFSVLWGAPNLLSRESSSVLLEEEDGEERQHSN